MRDAGARAREEADLLLVHRDAMRSRHAAIEDAEAREMPHGSRAVALPHHRELAGGLGQVRQDRRVETFRESMCLSQRLRPGRVGAVRKERWRHARVPPPFGEHPLGARETLGGLLRVGGRGRRRCPAPGRRAGPPRRPRAPPPPRRSNRRQTSSFRKRSSPSRPGARRNARTSARRTAPRAERCTSSARS